MFSLNAFLNVVIFSILQKLFNKKCNHLLFEF